MQIKFLRQTRNKGESVSPGDTAEVPAATAERWFKHGIAESVDGGAPNIASEDVAPIDPLDIPLKNRTNAVLKDLAMELGAPLPQKITKANLISVINSVRKRAEEGGDE